MYARRVGDDELTFDFALGLLNDNLLIADRETNSLWSQLHGKAISGPHENTPLEIVPSIQTTWEFWRQLHPDSRVGMKPDDFGRSYHYRDPTSRERRDVHDTSHLGLGLVVGGEAIYVPLDALEDRDYEFELGGEEIVLFGRPSAMTAWAYDARGQLLSAVLVYEEGWRDFFPETRVWESRSAAEQLSDH